MRVEVLVIKLFGEIKEASLGVWGGISYLCTLYDTGKPEGNAGPDAASAPLLKYK